MIRPSCCLATVQSRLIIFFRLAIFFSLPMRCVIQRGRSGLSAAEGHLEPAGCRTEGTASLTDSSGNRTNARPLASQSPPPPPRSPDASLRVLTPVPSPGGSHRGCRVYPHQLGWHVPGMAPPGAARDAPAWISFICLLSGERREADVMFLEPDASQRTLPQRGATAASGWLSA